MQRGNNELSEFDEFLIKWIAYLGQQKGRLAENLMEEAQSFVQDDDLLVENARKYVYCRYEYKEGAWLVSYVYEAGTFIYDVITVFWRRAANRVKSNAEKGIF